MAKVTRNALDRDSALAALNAEGWFVVDWTDEAGVRYPEHSHPTAEVRWILEGTMTVGASGFVHELGRGDRIDLDPGEKHWAVTGPEGVRYLSGSPR